jgi:putative flippase GtrA
MTDIIKNIIAYFHKPFSFFVPLKTFRYAFCGGTNLVLDTVLYFMFFQFVFSKQNLDLQFVVFSSHIASLFAVFPITFIVGFLLNKHIVFSDSTVNTSNQFFRYFISGLIALTISYISMKLLVDYLKVYPTPARLITIIITVLLSYLLQRKFTFKS